MADPGEGPGGPSPTTPPPPPHYLHHPHHPHPYFKTKLRSKGLKKNFMRPVPLLSQGLDGHPRPAPPTLFLRSESATVDCSAFLIFPCRYRLVKETKGEDKLFFFLFGRFVGFFFKRTENTRSNDHFVFFLLKETGR